LFHVDRQTNCVKIRPKGAELFRAGRQAGQTDRQTDRHEGTNSRFSQFCERAEKLVSLIMRDKTNKTARKYLRQLSVRITKCSAKCNVKYELKSYKYFKNI